MEKIKISYIALGQKQYNYDAIETILKDNPHLRRSWAENCGVDENDDRIVGAWPHIFEKFYDGYLAALTLIWSGDTAKEVLTKIGEVME